MSNLCSLATQRGLHHGAFWCQRENIRWTRNSPKCNWEFHVHFGSGLQEFQGIANATWTHQQDDFLTLLYSQSQNRDRGSEEKPNFDYVIKRG